MSATGHYVWDKVAGSFIMVSDRPKARAHPFDSRAPLREQIMTGYQKLEARGGFRSAWGHNRLKQIWGAKS